VTNKIQIITIIKLDKTGKYEWLLNITIPYIMWYCYYI